MSKVVKVSQISKNGVRKLNEDAVLVNKSDNVFAIFDGASSLVPYTSDDGKTGAYIAAHTAAELFKKSHASLMAAAIDANNAIEEIHKEAGIDVTHNLNRFGTTAIALKIANGVAELLSIGDSVAIFIYEDGSVKLPIEYHDHDIEIMRQWRHLADEGAKDIRQLINDDLLVLREAANSTYGSLNGDKRAERFMRTATVNLNGVRHILLLSDGMYLPKSDPDAEEDWERIARLYAEGGLEKILDEVRELEDSDPDLIKYPRYKLHDDASGIAIDLKK